MDYPFPKEWTRLQRETPQRLSYGFPVAAIKDLKDKARHQVAAIEWKANGLTLLLSYKNLNYFGNSFKDNNKSFPIVVISINCGGRFTI